MSYMAVAYGLALRKFLLFHHHVCSVYLVAISVCVASGLDTSGYYNTDSLTEISLCKFCLSSESHTADKISGRFSVPFETTVNSQCISCLLYTSVKNMNRILDGEIVNIYDE